MNKNLDKIFSHYNLNIYNEDKTEKTFTEVLSQIYYNFNKVELQSMMNDIMHLDLNEGDPFEQ